MLVELLAADKQFLASVTLDRGGVLLFIVCGQRGIEALRSNRVSGVF